MISLTSKKVTYSLCLGFPDSLTGDSGLAAVEKGREKNGGREGERVSRAETGRERGKERGGEKEEDVSQFRRYFYQQELPTLEIVA